MVGPLDSHPNAHPTVPQLTPRSQQFSRDGELYDERQGSRRVHGEAHRGRGGDDRRRRLQAAPRQTYPVVQGGGNSLSQSLRLRYKYIVSVQRSDGGGSAAAVSVRVWYQRAQTWPPQERRPTIYPTPDAAPPECRLSDEVRAND